MAQNPTHGALIPGDSPDSVLNDCRWYWRGRRSDRRCGQRRTQINKGGVVLVGKSRGRGFVRILTLGLPVSSLSTVSALCDLLEFLRADALLPHYLLAMRGPVLEVSTVLADDLLDSLILRPRLLLSLAVAIVPVHCQQNLLGLVLR